MQISLRKLKTSMYRATDGCFKYYLKLSGVADFGFACLLIILVYFSAVFAYLSGLVASLLVSMGHFGLIPWMIVVGFGCIFCVIFLLSSTLLFRILRMCTAYEVACLDASRTEGPPKPFDTSLH